MAHIALLQALAGARFFCALALDEGAVKLPSWGGAGPSGLIRAQEDAQTGMDIVCRELVEQSGKITYSKGAWEPCPRKLEPRKWLEPRWFSSRQRRSKDLRRAREGYCLFVLQS